MKTLMTILLFTLTSINYGIASNTGAGLMEYSIANGQDFCSPYGALCPEITYEISPVEELPPNKSLVLNLYLAPGNPVESSKEYYMLLDGNKLRLFYSLPLGVGTGDGSYAKLLKVNLGLVGFGKDVTVILKQIDNTYTKIIYDYLFNSETDEFEISNVKILKNQNL